MAFLAPVALHFLSCAPLILVFADGWDTLRSMIVGWSAKVDQPEVVANES
jgi:hypothetical protein